MLSYKPIHPSTYESYGGDDREDTAGNSGDSK